jgi:hypothetical protein
VGLERGYRGDQGSHPGGNTHCRVQDVVEHKSRGCQETGSVAKIFSGDGITATAVRIGVNCLKVGEKKRWRAE